MRILFGIHTWHPEGKGGTEVHARSVAHGLMGRGHQVGVFSRTNRPDREEYQVSTEWDGKIGVTRINHTFRDTQSLEWVYKNKTIHDAFLREIEEFKPDLIHLHHLTTLSTTIVEAAKHRGLPVVMTLHDFWTVCPRGQRMTKDLTLCEDVDRRTCHRCLEGLWPHFLGETSREPLIVDVRGRLAPAVLAEWDRHMVYILNLCDALICPSEFHRERMLDFPIESERLLALPHGLDIADQETRGLRVPKEHPRRIGFIGSVIPVKGVHVLIEAFKLLDRPELELHIHGATPSFHEEHAYVERLRAMAVDRPNIVFHGEYDVARVGAILADLDVLVVPSLWWETFCLTIREGLLSGLPVIASDLGAMREALDGERDGLLFAAGDARSLRDKLLMLLEDQGTWHRLHNRGAAVKTPARYLDELSVVYQEATELAQRRHGSLVVAPSSFPAPRERVPAARVATIPWEQIGVSVRQSGSARLALETKLPVSEDPKLTVAVEVKDGDRSVGQFDVVVDLGALAGKAPAKEASSKSSSKKRRKKRRRAALPEDSREARGAQPKSEPRLELLEGSNLSRRRRLSSGGTRTQRSIVASRGRVRREDLDTKQGGRHTWSPRKSKRNGA